MEGVMTIVLFTCKNFADKISYAYMMHSISTYTKKLKMSNKLFYESTKEDPILGSPFLMQMF